MVMGVNQTYYNDHFAIYTNTEPLHYNLEYNVLCQLHSIKKKKKKTQISEKHNKFMNWRIQY